MAYRIKLSNGSEIPIDREELQSVIEGITGGSKFIKVKNGIFNPSYMATIEPDMKRMEGEKYLTELPDIFEKIARIPSKKTFEETLRLEGENEMADELHEKKKELLKKYKPDFLKKSPQETIR